MQLVLCKMWQDILCWSQLLVREDMNDKNKELTLWSGAEAISTPVVAHGVDLQYHPILNSNSLVHLSGCHFHLHQLTQLWSYLFIIRQVIAKAIVRR